MAARPTCLPRPLWRNLLSAVVILTVCPWLSAQHPTQTPAMQTHSPISQSPNEQERDPFQNREMFDRLQKARETDRQRRIVDDAKRLVELTSQYRTLVEAHGTPTQDDQKLLMQIEKLARDVKDRMRGM